MGTHSFRAPVLPRLSLLLLICAGSLGAVSMVGCGSKPNSAKVSSGLFLAPITEAPNPAGGGGGISMLTDRLDFLRAIRPDALDSELVDATSLAVVLGRLSSSTLNASGKPTLTNDLLVYETKSRALLSVNICPEASDPNCGAVRLHYTGKGLEGEQGQAGGSISTDVTPIKLRNGWILTFDSSTMNIVAFREEAPREIIDDLDGDGTPTPRTLTYRSATLPNGSVDTKSKNFGSGNGLLLSVVVTGEEAVEQLTPARVFSAPKVARFVEVEENKVLVIFASATVTAVHLLELHEETATRDFDASTLPAVRPSELLDVKILRGQYKLFPGPTLSPFLTYLTIGALVGDAGVVLDQFQPLLIPDPTKSDPNVYPYPGSVLAFDHNTSTFLRIGVAHNQAGDILGGTVATAITPQSLVTALQGNSGTATVSAPFTPLGAYYNSNPKRKQILIFEEKTRSVLAFNYAAQVGKNLSIFVNSAGFLNRRNPRGSLSDSSRPALIDFAVGDVNSNRLGFDEGLEQIISISYTSSVVVVVANTSEISAVTRDPITDLSYIEPLDANNVRAFDSRSTSLLQIRIQYAAFPVSVKNQ